jgi:hypothetical protein
MWVRITVGEIEVGLMRGGLRGAARCVMTKRMAAKNCSIFKLKYPEWSGRPGQRPFRLK